MYHTFNKKKVFPYFTGFILCLMAMDGHARLSQVSARIENQRGSLFSVIGAGMEGIEHGRFQAIHPLPFVHVGSENIGAVGTDHAMQALYQTSLQTGLPTTSAVMSRTSVSQAFLSCGLSWELMEVPAIVNLFSDDRPLLVLADSANLRHTDKHLLRFAKPLFGSNGIGYYELPLGAFDSAYRANADSAEMLSQACTYRLSEGLFCDSLSKSSIYNDSTFQVTFTHGWRKLLELPFDEKWKGGELEISFWVKDFERDLIPRSVLEISQFSGEKCVDYRTEFLGKRIVGMRHGSALLEYSVFVQPNTDRITLAVENKLIQGTRFEINSLLVRPERSNCRILRHGKESLNNRIYSR